MLVLYLSVQLNTRKKHSLLMEPHQECPGQPLLEDGAVEPWGMGKEAKPTGSLTTGYVEAVAAMVT